MQGPSIEIEKPFLWTEGRIILKASLDKHYYFHNENVNVTVEIKNESKKIVRKIKASLELKYCNKTLTKHSVEHLIKICLIIFQVFIVQFVDVW